MSADNWAVCPRCSLDRDEQIEAMDVALDAAYGTVPVEQFDQMRVDRDALRGSIPECTFREDYEISGAEDGELYISYSGGCRECGLRHSFKHSEPMGVKR